MVVGFRELVAGDDGLGGRSPTKWFFGLYVVQVDGDGIVVVGNGSSLFGGDGSDFRPR